MARDVSSPRSNLSKEIRRISGESSMSLYGFLDFLRSLGQRTKITGPVVYYPFGGFDSHTPDATVQGLTDVFSVGLDPFGRLSDVMKVLQDGPIKIKAGLKLEGYDHVGPEHLYDRTDIRDGKGALAISRIISFLRGDVTGLYYFVISPDGKFKFLDSHEVLYLGEENYKNAVIEYSDKDTGNKKRFWYIQHDFNSDDPGFICFIKSLSFNTLFIKGALNAWANDQLERDKLVGKINIPALENFPFNCTRVIADRRRDGYAPDPIWATAPEKIELGADESFGYSSYGASVYYGPASSLNKLTN